MDPEEKALLEVVKQAIIRIRLIANMNERTGISPEDTKLIADLSDAIHNIPDEIMSGELNLKFQLDCMLPSHDAQHTGSESLCLRQVFENALNQYK